ncbi:MAG: aminotransferase class V-fold PLP-dependent enzyme [Devosia sp.]|uniref:aminotransferase class V-fold PLP-dependent enzyme n=1 Tax=Devosia sp. TaxID=1871048 RepID=UPI002621D252|nr:aminotransferase class V-fold PLP-dependent enzyme [Devosia sp.]MDB5541515.1 aminotransferase class V-fold PLP-dependent enzyme [Devosia sp.]
MTADLPLDTNLIRAEFPAFREPSLDGWAFLENAGGSYTSQQVLKRLDHYYRATKVQPYGFYPASREAGAAMDLAHRRMAQALNVGMDWIHFGPSTSANTYTLGNAFAGWLKPGDAIVVTNQDHEANSGAWRRLADRGMVIREWKVDPQTGHLDPAALDKLLDSKVRAVCFPHASNIVGEINPVAEIAQKAKSFGAVTVVDGVSYAPHGLPDLLSLGCDIYLFSAYKVYGPHQGVMAVRPSLASELPNQGHFFNETQPRKRLVPAGPDHAQIAASAGIADYLERVGELAGDRVEGANPFRKAHAAIRAQEEILLAPLMEFLRSKNNVRLIGPTDPSKRAPTVSLALSELAIEAADRLSRHKIMAGGGHFYAYRLLEALGLNPGHGVLRLSFTHYTSPAEIQQLIGALDAELK